MPNRILRESICVSESISRLSWFEESLFYRLIVNCDDYGRFDARLPVLKGKLFPLRDVDEQMIEMGLQSLEAQGCVVRYTVEGREYLAMTNWALYQRVRITRAKFPEPAADCRELRQIAARIQSVSESESESRSESESESSVDGECGAEGPAPELPAVVLPDGESGGQGAPSRDAADGTAAPIELPIKGGGSYVPPDALLAELRAAHPEADLGLEFQRMRGWLKANPSRRKTERVMDKFMRDWMVRAQAPRASRGTGPPAQKQTPVGGYAQRSYDAGFFDSFFADLGGGR